MPSFQKLQTQPGSSPAPDPSQSPRFSRRRFFASSSAAFGGLLLAPALLRGQPPATQRRMTICLTPGSIGVSANQNETIDLAARHGFESVEPFGGYLSSLSSQQLARLLDLLRGKGLVWGAAGLPVDFRQDEERFTEGLNGLPKIAAALAAAGVDRVGTWLMPAHNSLTYWQNFRQHVRRLREVARVLRDNGQRLGLEYVGTQTLRLSRRYPFVHTLAETQDLIAEIGTGNVGFVLDSWHWWTAGDTVEQLHALQNEEVVSVDLNDAPAGIPREQQIDNRRELPAATGVIDTSAFLNALQQIGYDGPVRAEPFNRALNELENEAACAAVIASMRKAFALIRAEGNG